MIPTPTLRQRRRTTTSSSSSTTGSTSTNNRPVVRNGRLEYTRNNGNTTTTTGSNWIKYYTTNFSLYRFVCILCITLLLWYSNPPNIPQYILQQNTKYKNNLLYIYNTKYMSIESIRNRRSITNYGIVSIIDNYSHLSIIGVTGYTLLSIPCDYTTNYNIKSIHSRICERLRTTVCHEKSLSLILPKPIIQSFLSLSRNKSSMKTKSTTFSSWWNKVTSSLSDTTSQSSSQTYYNTNNNTNNKQLTMNDIPFLIHRYICWIMIVLSLITVCYYNRSITAISISDNVWIDSILTLFVHSYYPIQYLLFNLVLNTLFVYPTLEKMYTIISLQHPTSIFNIFNTTSTNNSDDIALFYNYIISLLSLFTIAISINTFSKIWSNTYTCTLQFFAVVSVSLGYYRGCTDTDVDTYNTYNNDTIVPSFLRGSSSFLYNNGPSVVAITWITIVYVYYYTSNKSIVITVLYIIGNVIGYSMGQYQYKNIYILVSLSNVWDTVSTSFESLYNTFDSFIWNIRQQNYIR